MNILLTIAYDGTNYAGWQRQENAIAVQQRVEEALSSLFAQAITVTAASRTDAGVHALGQRASFRIEEIKIPLKKLPQILNSLLPNDISITAAQTVCEEFNPRFHAKDKTYRYQIYNAPYPNPLLSRYSTFIPQKLCIKKMRQAAARFVGQHDFAAFCATGSSAKTTVRNIFSCEIVADKDSENPKNLIQLNVTGDGFLYNMVRIIAGTILYIGMEKLSVDDILPLFVSGDRTKAGKTMPPEGLTLLEVNYDGFNKHVS